MGVVFVALPYLYLSLPARLCCSKEETEKRPSEISDSFKADLKLSSEI